MMMRLFLWLSVLWLAPMVAAMQANEAKFKKNIAVGVTIPREFQSDPALQASLLRVRRGEWAVCAGLVLSGAAAVFVRDFGATFTLWSVWLILLCVLCLGCGIGMEAIPKWGTWMDWVSIYIIPIGATFGAISWFYVMKKDEIMDAVGTKSKFWYAVGRYLYVPAALILCLVALFMKVAF